MEARHRLEYSDIYFYVFSLVVMVWHHDDGYDDE